MPQQMRDPKKIFTEAGYLDYLMHLRNVDKAMDFLMNSADDLMLDQDLTYDMAARWDEFQEYIDGHKPDSYLEEED